MEPGGGPGPTRQDEAPEHGQVGVEPVAVRLEPVDHRLLDTEAPLHACRDGEVGADVEELVLNALERAAELPRHLAGEDDPERRVQLVDRPVGLDAPVELRDARPVAERRLAHVPAARVDPRQPDRFVPRPRHAVSIFKGTGTVRRLGTSRPITGDLAPQVPVPSEPQPGHDAHEPRNRHRGQAPDGARPRARPDTSRRATNQATSALRPSIDASPSADRGRRSDPSRHGPFALGGRRVPRRRCATRLPLAAGEDDGRLPLARARVLPAAEPSPRARRDRRAESRPRYASAPRTPCCAHERPARRGPGPCGATASTAAWSTATATSCRRRSTSTPTPSRRASARAPPNRAGARTAPTRASRSLFSGITWTGSTGMWARGRRRARGVSRGRRAREPHPRGEATLITGDWHRRCLSPAALGRNTTPANLAAHRGQAPTVPDPSRSRAMTMRWISLVPS